MATTKPKPKPAPLPAKPQQQQGLLDYAANLIGTPYSWGGNDPQHGLDCSGLVKLVYGHYGINLPRTSQQMSTQGQAVTSDQAQAGDLVFYEGGPGQAGHVGIYLGNGKMLDAAHQGTNVRVEPIWDGAYFRRVVPANTNLGGASLASYGVSMPNTGQATSTIAALGSGGDTTTATVQQQYGYLAAFLKDKELGPILTQAAAQGWSSDRLQGALYKTKWWQNNSQSQRQFLAEATTDPATHQQNIGNRAAEITTLAAQNGVNLNPDRLNKLASDSLRYGWGSDQIKQAVGHEYHYDPTKPDATATQLRQIASAYLVPLSDATINQWGQQVASGQVTADDFKAYAIGQAKSMHPGLSAALDSGVTTQQYIEPYRQTAAKLLDLDPDSIDFSQQKWQKAIDTTNPQGQRGAMTLSDWQQTLKSDPTYGFDTTSTARTQAASFASNLTQMFGG